MNPHTQLSSTFQKCNFQHYFFVYTYALGFLIVLPSLVFFFTLSLCIVCIIKISVQFLNSRGDCCTNAGQMMLGLLVQLGCKSVSDKITGKFHLQIPRNRNVPTHRLNSLQQTMHETRIKAESNNGAAIITICPPGTCIKANYYNIHAHTAHQTHKTTPCLCVQG